MVSQVLLVSILALKLPDLTHQLCYSIAFLRKNNLSRSVCLCPKAGSDCTGLLWAAEQPWKLPVLQLCAAMQQGALQHSRAAGTALGTDRAPRACVLTPWEMAWMQLNRNSEMHCGGCNALENQAVSQVFVLAFLLECHGKNPCGCVTEISRLSPQRGTLSEDLLLRSWVALLLLLFLFQFVLCTCLCTHGGCSGRWLWNRRQGRSLGRRCWPNTTNIHSLCKYSGCSNFFFAVCNVYTEQPSAYADETAAAWGQQSCVSLEYFTS